MPAWLAPSPDGHCLFVARPGNDDVLSYSIGPGGELSAPSSAPSGGSTPVMVSLSLDGRFVIVANYDGSGQANATVASLAVGPGCQLSLVHSKRHTGLSTHPWRQTAAHVHSVYMLRSGLVYACDLGTDHVVTYALSAQGFLTELRRTAAPAGSGPRHIEEHPTLPIVYVLTELKQTVLVYKLEDGGLLSPNPLQEVNLVQNGAADWGSKAAELALTSDGSTLFATNRGALNTVTAFSVSAAGLLAFRQQLAAPAYPRGMTLANKGSVLLIAGQSMTELASYTVNDGRLTRTQHTMTKADGLPANPAAFGVLVAQSPLLL